jgi:hypothetical protein
LGERSSASSAPIDVVQRQFHSHQTRNGPPANENATLAGGRRHC